MTSKKPTPFTTADVLTESIDCRIIIKDGNKCGSLTINGKEPYIKFTDETNIMNVVKKGQEDSLKFSSDSDICKSIRCIEKKIESEGNTVRSRINTAKCDHPILFLQISPDCATFDEDYKPSKTNKIKQDDTINGIVRLKWVYKDKTDDTLSLKLVVVAIKHFQKEEGKFSANDL